MCVVTNYLLFLIKGDMAMQLKEHMTAYETDLFNELLFQYEQLEDHISKNPVVNKILYDIEEIKKDIRAEREMQ